MQLENGSLFPIEKLSEPAILKVLVKKQVNC